MPVPSVISSFNPPHHDPRRSQTLDHAPCEASWTTPPSGAGPCTPTSFCTSRCLSNCDSEHNPTTNRRGFTWSRPQFEQPGRKPMSICKLPSPTFGRALFGPLPSLPFYVHWRSRSMNSDQFLDSKMASTPWLTLDICTCTLSLSAEVCNCTVQKPLSSHSSGRGVTLLTMPPAWVDFCWVLVREKCDDVK
jgi:hypothetical protein